MPFPLLEGPIIPGELFKSPVLVDLKGSCEQPGALWGFGGIEKFEPKSSKA